MQVERTESRDGQQFGFQNLTISRDDECVRLQTSERIEHFWTIDSFRLKDRHTPPDRKFLDGIHMLMVSATGFLGLSQQADDGMVRFEQGTKRRQSKFARSHQHKF